ncbi:hypothetical protein LAZ67_13000775 [Cordylochernes scorpioides]|uniref:DUF7041 domain-containing protein n=1 Tax=Cordylochernes scorpioides TaxID=51811 RepID=A0ABY6L787_9ARAC|nr:hypothetical protein LAZ67_13000775 [Cordylochernes scorpioides]
MIQNDIWLANSHFVTESASGTIGRCENPEICFFQVEQQYFITGITSEATEFNYLVAQLELKYIEIIWDIVENVAASNKYSFANKRLLNAFQESESKKFKRLISGIELGDSKPSQLLKIEIHSYIQHI